MANKVIILSAPSGAGKTTIVHALLKRLDFLAFSVSATSRLNRGGEINGIDYWFLSPDQFKQKITNNEFIEYEEVYKNQFYGTLKSSVETLWKLNKTVIFDVDVIGGLNLKKYFGENALSVFIMPPSIDELEKRLRNRDTELEEKISMRIQKADEEISHSHKFDVIVENKNLDEAIHKAENLVINFVK